MAANKRVMICVLCIVLLGCFSRSAMMTYTEYDTIQTHTSISQLRIEIGKPYAIHHKNDGTEEYEYIERINSGNNLFAENHYFLIIKDGKVIGKYMTREKPPAYDLIYQEEPNYQN